MFPMRSKLNNNKQELERSIQYEDDQLINAQIQRAVYKNSHENQIHNKLYNNRNQNQIQNSNSRTSNPSQLQNIAPSSLNPSTISQITKPSHSPHLTNKPLSHSQNTPYAARNQSHPHQYYHSQVQSSSIQAYPQPHSNPYNSKKEEEFYEGGRSLSDWRAKRNYQHYMMYNYSDLLYGIC